MNDQPDPQDTGADEPSAKSADRRRLAEIFGDVLPEQVRDEVDSARPTGGTSDDWLREQVPPHHGRT